jgi:hypothetical protein
MALDLQNSYQQAQDKLKSYKTFAESKTAINSAKEKISNQLQPSFENSKFNLDSAEIERKIKKKVQSQFEELLGLISSIRGAGSSTNSFLIQKFIRAIKRLKTIILQILIEEFIKALGCDLEQTYDSQEFYIKSSSIDLFKILNEDPTSKTGRMFYEPRPYSYTAAPRSTNKLLYELSQNEFVSHSATYSGNDYLGYSTTPLFDIQFEQYNPNTGDGSGWYKVTLRDRPAGAPNKVSQFIVDYLKTIDLINIKALITALIEAVLGCVSINLRFATGTIDDSTKFGLLIQRILGLCFDNDQEISVGGQAKTPELDDTNESFFEMTDIDNSIIEQRTLEIKKGVVSFETCDNVELPVDSQTIIDIIEESVGENENIEAMGPALNKISTYLANDPRWQLQFPYPDQLKITLDFNFVKKIPIALISNIISPKVILPFITMIKALGIEYDENLTGLSNFMRQNRELMKNLISRIGGEFVKTLFDEIKKDIRGLVRQIITEITKDDSGTIYIMIEKLTNIALSIVSIINDYRKCKSVIDAILQLFNLIPKIQLRPIIPLPLLKLAPYLPGSSPNRSYINAIDEMQKLGLPTGPNKDGSPNMNLQLVYATLKGADREAKENGKVESAVDLPPPYGLITVTGKWI